MATSGTGKFNLNFVLMIAIGSALGAILLTQVNKMMADSDESKSYDNTRGRF